MSLNVLIAPDKFKGTLTARQAAEAIAEGWKKARPADNVTLLPISDGGDGFGEILADLWSANERTVRAMDAAHRPLGARWWWEPNRKAAIIESAMVIGLAQLPSKRFHPFDLDTYGLGKVIGAASRQGAQRCLIGIGGSATNDGGFGMAVALGWQFLDAAGRTIEKWTDLKKLESIVAPEASGSFEKVTVAVDVQNPLLGKNGASRIYGPQKGLQPRDFLKAEESLRRLAHIVKQDLGLDLKNAPGGGAAGGLGFGLAAFLGARLDPGFHLFAREARLATKLRGADLVITGEGRLDESTAMGKGVGELARLSRQMGIPCVGLAGEVVPVRKLNIFAKTGGITDLTNVQMAKKRPHFWLARLAHALAGRWVAKA